MSAPGGEGRPRDPEREVRRRDPGGLYGALDALYLTPADGFRELADTYDRRMAGNPLYLLESTETLAALPPLTGATLLDLGCGTGRYALQAARMGARSVIGVDLAPAMLVVARRKCRRAELDGVVAWQEGDLLGELPLPEAFADAAVCALALSYVADPGAALARMAGLLKPGGRLVVSDHHPHVLAEMRAASERQHGAGRDRAPYQRFTSASGEECRIAQHVHQVSALFAAARGTGLRLDHVAEPVVDRRLANTYAGLRDRVGVPLALVLRFVKES